MDFTESPEQALLREAVGKLAADFGHSWYAERAKAGGRSTELWQAVADQGYLGVSVPEAYGGGGGGISELAIVCEELAAAGCPLLLLVVSPAICASIIARFGTEEQKQRWLPQLADGRMLMAFAITEPDAGSNSHKISTVAARDGELWKLRGTKYYISGVDEAQAVLVVARTGVDEGSGRARLSLFVVPTDAAGLERTIIPVEIVAPEKQYTLHFDDVEVSADNLVGTEGEGLRQVFHGLNPERITGAAIANGIGRYALGKGAAYARERRVWDVPIGAHQGLAHPLATCYVEVELARLMTARAAWLHDSGHDAGESSNMAKYAAAEAALASLDQAIQVHGGNGLASEYGLADMWGFARLLRTAPVGREMILNYVASHSLGLPRSY
jgi:alkylation response protein AidB-like acyl-CoA dehydrogenase